MSEEKIPTNPDWVMKDPLVYPPPLGRPLLILTEGGVTIRSNWFDGAMAWAEHPVIPESVKLRLQSRYLEDKPKPWGAP